MFRIAICDDEKELCTWIEELLLSFAKRDNIALDTEVFYSGEELLKYLNEGNSCSLIILDIELETVTGVQIGQYIRKDLRDNYVQILYISGKQNYAMELFQNRPLNFLLKPLDEQKLIEEVKYAMNLEEKQEQFISFRNGKTIYRLPGSKILYFQSVGRKIYIYTTGPTYSFYGKLCDLEDRFMLAGFIMAHKSYLVNTYYINNYRYTEITMANDVTIPVSQSYRKNVKDFLIMRTKEEMDNE